MKKGGIGGGNTKTGIFFEKETDLASLLNKQPGYDVRDDDEYPSKSLRSHAYKVFYKEKLVARIFKQNTFYKMLEKELGIVLSDSPTQRVGGETMRHCQCLRARRCR